MPTRIQFQRSISSAGAKQVVEIIPIDQLKPNEVIAWAQLAKNSEIQNPFYEPQFLIPLYNSLHASNDVRLVVVRSEDSNRWRFACPVEPRAASLKSPVPVLQSFTSPYIFLQHPLLDATRPALTLMRLFDALGRQRDWHSLRVQLHYDSYYQGILEEIACFAQCRIRKLPVGTRSSVDLQNEQPVLERISKNRRKKLRKAWKWLEAQGRVKFQVQRPRPGESDPLDRFLALESLGWKGEHRTALSSVPSHEEFFRSMCANFAKEKRIWCGEILVDGHAIASTINILAGQTLFAFKIGWNPTYSDGAPGYWSEIKLAETASEIDPLLKLIDSCSSEDSYTSSVWPDKVELFTTSLAWSRRGKVILTAKSNVLSKAPLSN